MSYFSLATPKLTHRCFAIVAVAVLLAGKTLHVHQECGDCCQVSGSSASEFDETQVAALAAETCPFGCNHHPAAEESTGLPSGDHPAGCDHPGSDHPGSDPAPVHEEHGCAVCSVLAAAPECPLVMGLPEWSDLVQTAELGEACLPDIVEGKIIRLRGPPIA